MRYQIKGKFNHNLNIEFVLENYITYTSVSYTHLCVCPVHLYETKTFSILALCLLLTFILFELRNKTAKHLKENCMDIDFG